MATTKYELPTVDYSQTGWNANLKSAIESIDEYMHTWMVVTLGKAVSEGDALYLQNNGKWYPAFSDDTHNPAQGLAVEDGVADGTIRLQLVGPFQLDTFSFIVGKGVWLSAGTWGGVTQSKPSSHAQFLGIAIASDTINLNIAVGDGPSLPMSTTTTTTMTTTTTSSTSPP